MERIERYFREEKIDSLQTQYKKIDEEMRDNFAASIISLVDDVARRAIFGKNIKLVRRLTIPGKMFNFTRRIFENIHLGFLGCKIAKRKAVLYRIKKVSWLSCVYLP